MTDTETEPTTAELRNQLRQIIGHELDELPDTLKHLEPKERVNALIKLAPFVFGKVQSVKETAGEPFDPFQY